MIDTVVVDARGSARQLQALDMACDAKEIPGPLSGKPDSLWWAHLFAFVGKASHGGETGQLSDPVDTQFEGTKLGRGKAAMAVAGGKLMGIIAPLDDAQPALWWSWPLTAIKITTEGSQGLFGKRPRVIEITGPSGSITLGKIDKLYRSDVRRDAAGRPVERLHANEENPFLKAVGQS